MSKDLKKPTVVVVGGGPAGSSAVLTLGQLGHRAILVEKAEFPRDKVCGDGIPGKAFDLLARLGLDTDEIGKLGFPIFGMELWGPNGQRVTFGNATGHKAKSFCIPRRLLDHYLFRQAAAGAQDVLTPFKAVGVRRAGDRWQLLLQHNKTGQERWLTADVLIAADGATSLLSRNVLNFKVDTQHRFWGLRQYFKDGTFQNKVHIIYDKRLLPGYVWVFPVSRQRANVGLMVERASFDPRKSMPLQALFDQILHDNEQLRRILNGAQSENRYKGAPLPLGSMPGRRVAHGFLAIGDAAAFINPATGGGIYAAMQSGMVAAKVVSRALETNDWSASGLAGYERWWQQNLQPGFKAAEILRRLMRSPQKANFLFNRMKRGKTAAALFLNIYGQPVKSFFYLRPQFWLNILRAASPSK